MNESSTSTEKPSATASKEYPILDVTFEKGKVLLTFRHSVLTLSTEVYADGYYYPGKVLSEEEYRTLKEEERLSKAKSYLSLLLSRGRYTVKETADRLKGKYRLSEKQIVFLLKPYLEVGILSDLDYALDFIESRTEKGYGRNYLLSELRKRGVEEEMLNTKEVTSRLDDGIEALPTLLEKENRKRTSVPSKKREEQIRSFLERRGYNRTDIENAMEDFRSGKSEEEKKVERENSLLLLRKEARKCYNSVRKKYPDPKKQKQAFLEHLLRKGYEYSMIEEIIKEEDYSFHD